MGFSLTGERRRSGVGRPNEDRQPRPSPSFDGAACRAVIQRAEWVRASCSDKTITSSETVTRADAKAGNRVDQDARGASEYVMNGAPPSDPPEPSQHEERPDR